MFAATVCDQGKPNTSAVNTLLERSKDVRRRKGLPIQGITGETILIDTEKESLEIIPVYDTPHLLKGIRNNLWSKFLDLDYKCGQKPEDQKIAKWDVFVNAVMIDKYGPAKARAMPKITDDHLQPLGMKKMKVSIAAQTLSSTVAKYLDELSRKPGKSQKCV